MTHPRLAAALLTFALVALAVALIGSHAVSGEEDDDTSGIILPPPIPCFTLDDSFEDNDTSGSAAHVKLPFSANNLLSCEGDDDWFAFSAPLGAKIDIHADFEHDNGDVDLYLDDPSGGLQSSSISVTDDEDISFVANESGVFRLEVDMFDDFDGFGNGYDLDIDIGCPGAGTVGGAFTDALQEPLPVPDDAPGVINCVEILAPGTVNDLTVGVQISHTWVGDLIVTLEHVDTGTEVVLIDRPGFPATAFGCPNFDPFEDIDVELSDGAGADVEDKCNPTSPTISGSLRPHEPLAAFNGESIAGTWRIQVTDTVGADLGTLDEWWIESTVKAPTVTPTATPVPATSTPTVVPPTSTPTAVPPTATPAKALGDVNDDGSVNSVDSALILQLSAGLVPNLPNEASADVDENGMINAVDSALILQLSAGLIPALPP